MSVGESFFVFVSLNQALQESAADSAGSVWQVAGLVHTPQDALGKGCDGCTEFLPWHATLAISDCLPMKVQAVIVSVATIANERAGWGTRGAAACADRDWSRLGVGADTGEMETEGREGSHGREEREAIGRPI